MARFHYDAINRRVARQDGNGWIEYVHDPSANLLAEVTRPATAGGAWSTKREYVWLDGQPLAQLEYPGPAGRTDGYTYYFHLDHLGQPRALTGESGATVWSAGPARPYGDVAEATWPDSLNGRTVVTNLRLPGQHDERLLSSVGLQGPYYNWNRWYLPSMGRYMELDPIAVSGGFNGPFTPEWYTYVGSSPNRYVDPTGLAYFAKRPLTGLWWLWPIARNPWDDRDNTELVHEQLFFEDGGSPPNYGFFHDGRMTEWYPAGYRPSTDHFNDCVMRRAVEGVALKPYSLLGDKKKRLKKNNCQDWAQEVRDEYQLLLWDARVRKDCGL